MRKTVICLIILGLISCNKKKIVLEHSSQVKQSNEHLSKKDTISGSEYIFYFKKEKSVDSKNSYCNLDSLVVLKKNKRYVLNLLSKKISLGESLLLDGVYTNEDYNFDGINDIMLYPHRDNHSVYSVEYFADYFLYNKKSDKFESNGQLDTIPNLEICKKGEYLFSNNGDELRKYKWKGDSLKIIEVLKIIQQEKGSNKFHCK